MRYISNNTSTTATLIDTYMTNRWRDIDKHIHTHSLTHTHIQNVQSLKNHTLVVIILKIFPLCLDDKLRRKIEQQQKKTNQKKPKKKTNKKSQSLFK